jgi:hypothetical protein
MEDPASADNTDGAKQRAFVIDQEGMEKRAALREQERQEAIEAIRRRRMWEEAEEGCCLRPANCGPHNGRCIVRDEWLAAQLKKDPDAQHRLIQKIRTINRSRDCDYGRSMER